MPIKEVLGEYIPGWLERGIYAAPGALATTIGSLNIQSGASFFVRWTDTDASGADDGLAVDEFSVTPHGAAPQPNLTINDVSLNEGNAGTTRK